jgi:hypothetical protein
MGERLSRAYRGDSGFVVPSAENNTLHLPFFVLIMVE